MPARTITITSGKGGVGKTTLTANLAVALAMKGHKVVAIDADIGLRNLDVVMGLENRIVYDLVDVVEGTCRLKQAMIRDKRQEGLYLLPAAQKRDKMAVTPDDMRSLISQMDSEFDFVLVDSPAGIERGFQNAIAGASEVIIVTTPEVSAVRDADRIIGLVEAAEKSEPRLVINRLKPSMVKHGDMLSTEDVIEVLAISLLGIVPEDEDIIVSTNRGVPAAFDASSPSGLAFHNISRRVLGEEVPFMNVDERQGFWGRIVEWFRSG